MPWFAKWRLVRFDLPDHPVSLLADSRRLPQATSATVRVCSLFGGDLGQMGILRWCEQVLGGKELDRVIRAAKENRSWLITPWQNLELAHAVQQPLVEPKVERFDVLRGTDQPWADLFGEVVLDVPSTEKIEVVAAWSETVDDLSQAGPEVRQAQTAVFDLPLRVAARGRTDAEPQEIPYSLRDGKLLTFFTTRARERGLPAPAAHAFGDTHDRHVTYRVVATTPFREHFPPEWSTQPDLLTRTGEPQERDVLSSAPPATPKVLYSVPTLGWEANENGGATVRHRRGGGLRVYLARPWFSSGDGELLGVIVGPSVTSPGADNYPYVTLVGQDPVRGGAPLEFATPGTFRNAAVVTEPLEPIELSDRVIIAAFQPVYDTGTQRWFCDIDFDTGDAYLPFVRLSLVRY